MISVVVPIYNEEEIISVLHAAIVSAMEVTGEEWEVVYVNDGSRDSSLELLRGLQAVYSNIVVADLSRNWGHPGALVAGLQTARGDAVVLMDGDLQDPPDVIPELVSAWRTGAQVVTAVRRSRQESRKYLAVLFPLFYRIFGALSDYPIPLNAGIFGLLDRQAVDSINALREGNRYFPGLRAWVGYRTATVYYDRQDRVGGEGKLSFMSRIKYATDAITSFSYKPLRVSFVLSAVTAGFAGCLALAALFASSALGPLGFGIAASIFFVGSLLLFCLGILGEYMGRVYDEVRGRPQSIISRVHRVEQAIEAPAIAGRDMEGRDNDLERLLPAA